MEFTGRITTDAKSSIVKGDKEVVNFAIVQNESYKTKEGENKQFTTFINIAWWRGTGIMKVLKKGAIVTVNGRLFCNAYTDMSGNAKGSINCHANSITVIEYAKTEKAKEPAPAEITEPMDELPF